MTGPARSSYDDVPYTSNPFPQTHPDRLATVAALLGMRPKPVDRCRVLELGCASGGNLIPMALSLPESTFLGVELSGIQAGQGQRMIRDLGLRNIELKHLDILSVDQSFGKFDYIVCHGVYSWVPSVVQDKILRVCVENLAPSGVAYVSYNTYPGWHMRMMIREMMCYHVRHFNDAKVRTAQARKLLDFLAESVRQESGAYSHLLRSEVEVLQRCQESYLYHEHLEPFNEPIYFYQFVERAEAKGLQYLGETQLDAMLPANYPPDVSKVLQILSSDDIHLEQYMDFLRNRTFRQTLLCHKHIVRNRSLRPEQLAAVHVASPMKPKDPNLNPGLSGQEDFETSDGIGVKAGEPLAKAALLHLSEIWPSTIAFTELVRIARSRLPAEPGLASTSQDAQSLGELLLSCYGRASDRLVELHLYPPKFAAGVSEMPTASALARLQAAEGNVVTTLRHGTVMLDALGRQLVPHLDGKNNRARLVSLMREAVGRGDLAVEKDGQSVNDPGALQELLNEAVQEQLRRFAASALLIS